MQKYVTDYIEKLAAAIRLPVMQESLKLAYWIKEVWQNGRTIYICGNGGSAGNAIHLANDFTYGAGKKNGVGIRV
jgi:D-sedoheptulose 7-phosphate isomerase